MNHMTIEVHDDGFTFCLTSSGISKLRVRGKPDPMGKIEKDRKRRRGSFAEFVEYIEQLKPTEKARYTWDSEDDYNYISFSESQCKMCIGDDTTGFAMIFDFTRARDLKNKLIQAFKEGMEVWVDESDFHAEEIDSNESEEDEL